MTQGGQNDGGVEHVPAEIPTPDNTEHKPIQPEDNEFKSASRQTRRPMKDGRGD